MSVQYKYQHRLKQAFVFFGQTDIPQIPNRAWLGVTAEQLFIEEPM